MPARRLMVVAALTWLAALLAGCAPANNVRYNVHYTLLEKQPRPVPKKLVLLPVDMHIKELSAGGVVEEVKQWTAEGKANVTKAVAHHAETTDSFTLVPMPPLNDAERSALDEHVALYNLVAFNAFMATHRGGPAWQFKVDHFDYTLGDGLAFLRQRSGADAALIVVGDDVVSSSGRKAAFVLAAALGVGLQMGHSFLTAGVIDLKTGDLLWFDYAISAGSKDLRESADAQAMMDELLDHYPGLAPYRARLAAQKH